MKSVDAFCDKLRRAGNRDLQSHRGPNDEKISPLMIDRLVWMYKPASPGQAEYLRSCGLTLANIQAAERSADA